MNTAQITDCHRTPLSTAALLSRFRVMLIILGCWLIGECVSPTIAAGQVDKNQSDRIQRELEQLYDGIEFNFSESPFLSPPRESLRPIVKTKTLIKRGEIKQAVEILGELLAQDRQDDFLIPETTQSYGSLRMRTERILGWLGKENRKDYEFRYGIRAKKWLDEGLADNDINKLKLVSEKYFFTPAGVEAVMVLGHLELSAGRPSIAVSWFQKVLRYPELATQYEPEVSISLATCQLLSGNRTQADSTLASLKQRMPSAVVSLMGESRSIFAAGDDRIAWLTSLIGDSPLAKNVVVSKWLVSSGNVARTGKIAHGLPLIVPTWKQSVAGSEKAQKLVDRNVQRQIDQQVSPASAVRPLVIGDTVLARTADQTYGVDINTGKRLWVYPPNVAWNRKSETEDSTQKIDDSIKRSYENAIYGQASSDGRLAFLIPFPGHAGVSQNQGREFKATREGTKDWRTYNELVAIDCQRQGAVRWRIGGENGLDEPELAKAFFLGEPLPWEGQLYCACVLNAVVKLVVLDSRTGELKWSLDLASTTREFPDLSTLGGITPSYADGKLFMTTGTGALVAIDISNRSLAWGYVYKRHEINELIVVDGRNPNVLRDTWRDAQIVVAESKVLLTCRESLELICLDAESGASGWRRGGTGVRVMRTENKDLYVAGIFRNQAILVGLNKVRGIDLNTGKQNFVVDFSEHGVMSGRGYIGRDSLYLPATNNSVVKIDLLGAKIDNVAFTDVMPGNIVRVGNKVISHSPGWLASFPELGETEKELEAVAKRGGDFSPKQSLTQAQVLIQRGKLKEAISVIKSLADSEFKSQCAGLLAICFKNYQLHQPEIALEILEILGSDFPEQGKELREKHWLLTALRTGKTAEAIRENLAQMEKFLDEPDDIFGLEASENYQHRIFIPADLMDPLHIEKDATDQEASIAAEEIQYCQTGWHQALLNCSWKILRQSDPDMAEKLRVESEKLILDRLADPESLEHALELIPLPMLSTEAMESVSRARLKNGELLAALLMAHEAARRSPMNPEFILLKSEILAAGKFFEVAAKELKKIQEDQLSEAALRSFETLQAGVQKGLQEKTRAPFSAGTENTQEAWHTSIKSVMTEKYSGDTLMNMHRLECSDFPDYRKLRLMSTFDGNLSRLSFVDANGAVLKQISNTRGMTATNRRPGGLEISKQIGSIRAYGSFYLFDCFKLNNNKDSALWNAYGTNHIDGVHCYTTRSNTLSCYDTISGRRLWRREFPHSPSGLMSNSNGMISVLLEDVFTRIKFDGHSGGMTGTSKASLEELLDVHGGRQLVMRDLWKPGQDQAPPKQSLSNERQQEQGQDRSKIERKLVLLDFDGNVMWEKETTRLVQHTFLNDRLFVLDHSGELEVIDVSTANVVSKSKLKLTSRELDAMTAIRATEHRAGIVLRVVQGTPNFQRFNRGLTSYQIVRHNDGDTQTGPIILLDRKTFQPQWENPARLEMVYLIPSQPFEAPFLVFARGITRRALNESNKILVQLILLDVQTGKLVLNRTLLNNGNVAPRCFLERVEDSGSINQQLVLRSNRIEMTIKLDAESRPAPAPPVDLGLGASIPYHDTALPFIDARFKDAQKDQFENAALEAAQKAQSELEKKALELKQKMGIR